MSEQSDREKMDKRVADLVAHKTPDELAREMLNLQDAQQRNAEESQRAAEQQTAQQQQTEAQTAEQPVDQQQVDNPLEDSGDKHSKHKRR